MTQALTHNGLPAGLTRWQFFGLIQTALMLIVTEN